MGKQKHAPLLFRLMGLLFNEVIIINVITNDIIDRDAMRAERRGSGYISELKRFNMG